MPEIDAIRNTPDISFIDNKTVDDVRGEMVSDFESFLSAASGETVSLGRASVHRMILYAAAAQIYQALQYIDRDGKQNLLKYSYSDFLDNIALLKGITRAAASAASATLRFTLSAVRPSATGIPASTRAASSGSVYFQTTEYVEIPAGGLTADVPAVCTVTGTAGNGLAAGELSTLVDPVPYVESVINTAETAGGAEIESDEDLAERVFLAPGGYSTAGPEDAYIYHAKAYSAAVGDVKATSDQAAGRVDIVFLLADGSAPGAEMISGLQSYLRENSIRPMNDLVTVAAPAEITYTVNLTYYINRSDSPKAAAIQSAVADAVTAYIKWQRAIGRDVNPSKLVSMVMAAGAKRVQVTSPVDAEVGGTSVPALSGTAAVNYGGLEDD